MRAAIDAGARIVNDISALAGDAASTAVVAASGVSVVLMHMQGEPRTMQQAPHYDDAPTEVAAWLAQRVAACEAAGIARQRIAVDPGIGFGKTVEHNLRILARLEALRGLGAALVVGVSRKSFIARVDRDGAARDRLGGSLAAALWAVLHGADILRVHDVAATRQALAVWAAIDRWSKPPPG
jgi:dihydropteroate synthase